MRRWLAHVKKSTALIAQRGLKAFLRENCLTDRILALIAQRGLKAFQGGEGLDFPG